MMANMPKNTKHNVLQVALKIPFADHLEYSLPDHLDLPAVGSRVVVPLGKNKPMVGVVVAIKDHSQLAQLKPIQTVLDDQPILNANALLLLKKAAKYYQVTWGEMIFTALPGWFRRTTNKPIPLQKWWQTIASDQQAEQALARAPKQLAVFKYLKSHGPLTSKSLRHLSSSAATICQQLAEKGLIQSNDLCFINNRQVEDPQFTLTNDQQNAIQTIHQHQDGFKVLLLDGITGSGKTEVYIQHINRLLQQKKQAMVLVPEIGLTPQLFQEISQRVNGQMAVLHSGLSDGARARVWHHCRSGQVDVVVATRSGIFTAFKNLGAILVDEEHDLSYKQQDGVRYSARDLAVLRGQIEGIPVILGSATPSFETLNHAMEHKYLWLKLRTRTNQMPMPQVTLQNTQNKKLHHGLSGQTVHAIEDQLEQGRQVLVFLNRRGWSPKLLCHECNWIATCDDCDAYLTYHKQVDLLVCHHCQKRYSIPEFCPQCGSQDVATLGVGTEKIANGLIEKLGQDQVVRFDRDAVKTPSQWQDNLAVVRSGNPCVIVGTQMLAKGHDFPLLSLVVVVNVDNSFFSTDFRATEYLAQLLIQVSGRAGRAGTKGAVIIQTQFAEHPFFHSLFAGGYEQFAQQQLTERAEMLFPPFAHMAIIRAQHRNEQLLDQFLSQMAASCEKHPHVSTLGPIPAPLAKKQKLHRMQLILNANERRHLHQMIHELKTSLNKQNNVQWFVDIDPVGFD